MGALARSLLLLAALSALALIAPVAASPAAGGAVRAGVAAVDASWHVGASAGQYATDGSFVGVHGVDPTTHSYRKSASYGIQSRLSARALVVEGADGTRVALVKNDLYIPQDLLYRRTAQLLEQGDSGITRANLTIAVTHDHSSPYYSSTSWGAWAFQDVYDVRFFDYYAKRMAEAVERAAGALVPVRIGASVSTFDKTHRHSFGPAVADDGTPAGYPNEETDHDLTVVRFDDVSDAAHPKPLANLVNFSLHPEMLSGNDLISADYVAPMQRMVDRETGGLTIFTQNAVGTAEPERSTYHSMHERLEFTHREYAQAEYGARLMSDAIVDTWRDVERETPERSDKFVRVPGAAGRRHGGPVVPRSHLASLSRRLELPRRQGLQAAIPQFPVVGLPDCENASGGSAEHRRTCSASTARRTRRPCRSTRHLDRRLPGARASRCPRTTRRRPTPGWRRTSASTSRPSAWATSCSPSARASSGTTSRATSRRAPTRRRATSTTATTGRRGARYNGDLAGTWTCPNPRNPSTNLPPIPSKNFLRMKAQVNNHANGWNDLSNLPWAESEPTDPTKIKGNYTHAELPPGVGYRLTVPISMANDYNGYIASYREYQRGDHYRKALTGWGPHSSDYMATRLVGMGGELNGGPTLPHELGQEKVTADVALNDQRADKLGEIGETSVTAYEAALPDDGGTAAAVQEPRDIERFAATFFKWVGGSNFTDNPHVKVQRLEGGEWRDYAGQSGEIPVTLEFPQGEDVPSYLQGGQEWRWTAHFEAFASNFDTIEGVRATPAGTYRFVVDGLRREGRRAVPYHLESQDVRRARVGRHHRRGHRCRRGRARRVHVGPRRTLTVSSGGPTIQAEIGPIDYPDSYASPIAFIDDGAPGVPRPGGPRARPRSSSGTASAARSGPGRTPGGPRPPT